MKNRDKRDKRIYKHVREIPKGMVTSYREIALKMGGTAQQTTIVIEALKRLRQSRDDAPYHRVINSTGDELTLGSYGGSMKTADLANKRDRLKKEGVFFDKEIPFEKSKLINRQFYRFGSENGTPSPNKTPLMRRFIRLFAKSQEER